MTAFSTEWHQIRLQQVGNLLQANGDRIVQAAPGLNESILVTLESTEMLTEWTAEGAASSTLTTEG